MTIDKRTDNSRNATEKRASVAKTRDSISSVDKQEKGNDLKMYLQTKIITKEGSYKNSPISTSPITKHESNLVVRGNQRKIDTMVLENS